MSTREKHLVKAMVQYLVNWWEQMMAQLMVLRLVTMKVEYWETLRATVKEKEKK